MKKIYYTLLFIVIVSPLVLYAATDIGRPSNFSIVPGRDTATLSWENTQNLSFFKYVLFRSSIPIEEYFTYEAVEGLCDKIYEGNDMLYLDTGLAVNLSYYYILFASDKIGNKTKALVIEKKPSLDEKNLTTNENSIQNETKSLSGATSETVNQVSLNEAGIIYNYNKAIDIEANDDSRRLSLFIIVKSPHDLNENDKNAISYFIQSGTPTTIVLGNGERAGVLNSYLSAFDKLPRNILEWQDVIKIANGRWPTERNIESEEEASGALFSALYERKPDINNSKDNSAVTIIAYGLRPAQRNIESEKNAISIYNSIFKKSPSEASDWDLVRAIAYSGATR